MCGAMVLAGPTWAQEPSAEVVSPEVLLQQAQAREAAQAYDEAIALYRRYLDHRPEDDEARAAIARVLSWQGNYGAAIALYEDILSRRPVDHDVRIARARVTAWQKQWRRAQALYEEVLRDEPTNQEAKRGLADVLWWRGQRLEALRLYEAVYAVTGEANLEARIRGIREELTALTPAQAQRAPVGSTTELPSIPFRDYYKLGYSHFTYTNRVPDERAGRVEVGKAIGAQTVVGRLDHVNRFGFQDTQVSGELYSPFWEKAWGYVAASAAVDADFLPGWMLGGELFQGLGALHRGLSFIEPSFGYRHMVFRAASIDLLTPGLTVYLPYDLWLTEKLYYVPDTGAMTLSSQLTWRPTDRVQVFASYGFGTAGERITATQDFTRVSSRITQGGLIVPISSLLSAEASVYYEDRSILYIRRGGTLNLIYHW